MRKRATRPAGDSALFLEQGVADFDRTGRVVDGNQIAIGGQADEVHLVVAGIPLKIRG